MGLKFGFAALPSFDGWKPDIRANYGGSDRKSGLIGPDGGRCMARRFDLGARNRLESGADYSESDFEAYWKHARLDDGQRAADIRDSVVDGRCLAGGRGINS